MTQEYRFRFVLQNEQRRFLPVKIKSWKEVLTIIRGMRWWESAWNKATEPRNDLFWEALWNEASKELERWWGTHNFECRCKGKPQKGNCPLSEHKMKVVLEKKIKQNFGI